MKIGVLSDTHIMDFETDFPQIVYDTFETVDHVIHCGDFVNTRALILLESLCKPFHAVSGNMDDDEILERFPERSLLEFAGLRIGVYHGRGAGHEVIESVKAAFSNDACDAYVFGHSHIPTNSFRDGILYFNPGSVFEQRTAPYCSIGVLTIEGSTITGEIIPID